MTLRQRLLAPARACGAAALKPFVSQPSGPWLPVGVYGTVALACVLGNLLGERPPAWVWVVLPATGFLLWTLIEYVLHSRFFHDPPRHFGWLGLSHCNHHEAPDDPNRIVARLSFSFPVAVILFAVVSVVLWSVGWAALVFVGLVVGYLSYEVIHDSIHRVPAVRRLLRPLASHHLHHHYADPSRCFGVTSPLWDWVFRTGRRSRAAASPTAAAESARPAAPTLP